MRVPVLADTPPVTLAATLATVAAVVVAGLVPLLVGVRRGQLTAGVVAGTFAAGAVIQFGELAGAGAAAGLTVLLMLLPRRVVKAVKPG